MSSLERSLLVGEAPGMLVWCKVRVRDYLRPVAPRKRMVRLFGAQQIARYESGDEMSREIRLERDCDVPRET